FKAKKDWPMFRTFEPNYFPWYLNKKEVIFFTHILEQSCILLKEAELNPKKLIAKKKDHYVLKYLEKGEWKTGEIKPNEYIKPEIKPMVDLNLVDKVKKISIKKGLVWEIQSLRLPDPVMDEGDEKPYYPYVAYIADKKAKELLEKVGMSHRKNHFPSQISGGEMARTSIARALMGGKKIILADEPTGNLDKENSKKIIELLWQLHEEFQFTLIIVTHDTELTQKIPLRYKLLNGKLELLSKKL
ncbi:MAG: ATP-binding cassette domain-containing protein, partial [Candidatus Sericytochromatia bacterium]